MPDVLAEFHTARRNWYLSDLLTMVDLVGRRVVVCLEGSFPSRSQRVAVPPGIFCPHRRLGRCNKLPGFLNKLFAAFDDALPGFFV